MKLGKRFGCVAFVVGLLGSVLFYASPPSFLTYESHLLCPWCPYIDMPASTFWTWLTIGVRIGLMSGLVLAALGFAMGCAASRIFRAS